MNDKSTESGDRAFVFHPFVMCIWPVVALYAGNIGEVQGRFVIVFSLVAAMLGFTSFMALWWLIRNAQKAGLLLTCFVTLFFCYAGLRDMVSVLWGLVSAHEPNVPHPLLLPLWCVATIGICWYVLGTRQKLQSATRVLNAVSVVVLLFNAYPIVVAHWEGRRPRNSTDGLELMERPSEAPKSLPDIWYIVPDRYASAETLASAYDFDNQPFLDALRSRGFYIAEKSQANYARTFNSLSCTLNLDYHPETIDKTTPYIQLPLGHRVGEILKSKGYRYYHIGGIVFSFTPTDINALADWQPDIRVQPMSGSHFFRTLLSMTPLQVFHTFDPNELDKRELDEAYFINKRLLWTEEIAKQAGPKFVFSHMILPHPPFVFSRDGKRQGGSAPDGSKPAYVEQLEFTNSVLLKTVDVILANSETPPVIVIQADEGPYLRGDDFEKSKLEARRIRTGILSAFHVPDAARARLYPQISPVNTFRLLFRECLGLDIELLDDRIFVWPSDQEKQAWPPQNIRSDECVDHPDFQDETFRLKFIDVTAETIGK